MQRTYTNLLKNDKHSRYINKAYLLLEKFDGNPEKSGRIFFNEKHVTPGSAKPKM